MDSKSSPRTLVDVGFNLVLTDTGLHVDEVAEGDRSETPGAVLVVDQVEELFFAQSTRVDGQETVALAWQVQEGVPPGLEGDLAVGEVDQPELLPCALRGGGDEDLAAAIANSSGSEVGVMNGLELDGEDLLELVRTLGGWNRGRNRGRLNSD